MRLQPSAASIIRLRLATLVGSLVIIAALLAIAASAARASRSALGAPSVPAQGAVVDDPGCRAVELPSNDDGSAPPAPIGFSIDFFGAGYSQLYVNNNGNVTFEAPLRDYTPYLFDESTSPIIAPFFADVDTRGVGSDLVTYSYGPITFEGHSAFCANWVNVGYYSNHADKLNSFQLLIVDRSDIQDGDFDIVMNYDQVLWETGDASGGDNGFGGTSAGAGYSGGNGDPSDVYNFPGSLENGAFLDSNQSSGLIHNSRGSDQLGRYIFQVRSDSFFQYVALGDSYSSGEGLDPKTYFLDGYDPNSDTQPGNIPNGCHRSSRAYAEHVKPPYLPAPFYVLASGGGESGRYNKYGSEMNVRRTDPVSWVFWACHDAKTVNVFRGGIPQFDNKHREKHAQLDNPSVNSATDVVTITIGGNDVGFAKVIEYCGKKACNKPGYRRDLEAKIDGLTPTLLDLYQDIQDTAPTARVIVLGYPQVFPASEEEQSCAKLTPWLGEQDFLREMGTKLDEVIRYAATEVGVEFVEVADDFAGHEVCGNAGEWIKGPFSRRGSFHPNEDGHQAYKDAVNAALSG